VPAFAGDNIRIAPETGSTTLVGNVSINLSNKSTFGAKKSKPLSVSS